MRYMAPGETPSSLLDTGEVDAALSHQVPACFAAGSPRVKRLFSDYGAAEIDYYKRTGVHPIMHCVVLKKSLYESDPWVLRDVYKALCESREKTMARLSDTGALSAMVPMLPAVMDKTREIFGDNFWPYGVEANRKTLEKLVLYAHQQGLTPRLLEIEELFGESVRDF